MNFDPTTDDSPFAHAYGCWLVGGTQALWTIDPIILTEYADVADSLIDQPVYQSDADLVEFRDQCRDLAILDLS